MKREISEDLQRYLNVFCGDLDVYFGTLESKWEAELIELFSKLNITASVKTDKYSLPHQGEVIVTLMKESYINGMFERHRIFRPIIQEMLNKDAFKIRFYFHIETYSSPTKPRTMFEALSWGGGIKYSFRYFIH